MNKKITLYELLGLAKDGKELPKLIKYDSEEYKITKILMENNEYYYNYICNDIECLFPINTNCLNDYVEILDDEDMEIEEIKYYDDSIAWVIDGAGQLSDVDKIAIDKINELVREINKLKKEGM